MMNDYDALHKEVIAKCNKEYKEFRKAKEKLTKEEIITDSLRITFFKEIHKYIINEPNIPSDYLAKMNDMNPIIGTMWNIYKERVVDKSGDHYLTQLLEFYCNNLERIERRLREE